MINRMMRIHHHQMPPIKAGPSAIVHPPLFEVGAVFRSLTHYMPGRGDVLLLLRAYHGIDEGEAQRVHQPAVGDPELR